MITSRTQAKLPPATVSYWVSVLQLIVFSLAAVWLIRNVAIRGFVHTSGVAVGAMQNVPT
jgi:hypothetical protein